MPAWWRPMKMWLRENVWLVTPLLVLLLLIPVVLVSFALASIAWTLRSQHQASIRERAAEAVQIANTKAEAEASATKALADLLVKNGMSAEEAGRVAQKAAAELLEDLSRDTSGQMARKFGEWIRASRAPSNAQDVREKSAAVLPYIKSALERGLQALTVPGNAAKVVADLTTDALGEIGKGFFGGLGALPWDLLKEWITRPSGTDRPIVVNCTSCPKPEREKQPPEPPPCPKCPDGVPPCPKCPQAVTHKFEIRFAHNKSDVQQKTQTDEVDKAAKEALRSKDATVLLWAHTDTTGSDTHNQRLSKERGESVRKALMALEVPETSIRVVPMGEHELPVPTGDKTPEQKNRVVKIEVRSVAGP